MFDRGTKALISAETHNQSTTERSARESPAGTWHPGSNTVNLTTSAQSVFRPTNTAGGRTRSITRVTHMAMNSLDDIKAAIQRLTEQERQGLRSWLVANLSYDTDVLGDRVAEPAVAYGASAEHQRLSVDEYLKFEEN